MDDLTITRLCAEAMGLQWGKDLIIPLPGNEFPVKLCNGDGPTVYYAPLHDDAQAMALVKKFRLHVVPNHFVVESSVWHWYINGDWDGIQRDASSAGLNRAICECVARMQKGSR